MWPNHVIARSFKVLEQVVWIILSKTSKHFLKSGVADISIDLAKKYDIYRGINSGPNRDRCEPLNKSYFSNDLFKDYYIDRQNT